MNQLLYKCLAGIFLVISSSLSAQLSEPTPMQNAYKAWQQQRLHPQETVQAAPQAQANHFINWQKQRRASPAEKQAYQKQATHQSVLAYKQSLEKRKANIDKLKQQRKLKKAERQANKESSQEARSAKRNEVREARQLKR